MSEAAAERERPHAANVKIKNGATGEERVEHPHVRDSQRGHGTHDEDHALLNHNRGTRDVPRSPSARLPVGRVASPEANEEWHREKVMQMRMVRDQLRAARKLAAEAEGIVGVCIYALCFVIFMCFMLVYDV
jgi:hypothetical protein